MIERESYPPGVPCWVDTAQPDPEAAASFYSGLFGWDFEDRMPPGSPGRYLVAKLRGRDVAAVGSPPEGMPPAPVWMSYVSVASADEAAARAEEAGGTALMEPFDVPGAGRMAALADPEGAAFCAWEAKGTIGAQLVNEPGTWNSSELHTRDLGRAEEFYGAVFGWVAATVDLGEIDFSFWRLPGYGDHLAERDPELRERMAAQHVPPGFEDAVAWIVPASGSDETPPPHWSITFAVDDADAVAARAAELGGTVLVPPFDAPYVRMTVLRDPQGATFTASKYVPPG
jgi:hypothetical protein